MDLNPTLARLKPAGMADEEWGVRLELAAMYRLFVHCG